MKSRRGKTSLDEVERELTGAIGQNFSEWRRTYLDKLGSDDHRWKLWEVLSELVEENPRFAIYKGVLVPYYIDRKWGERKIKLFGYYTDDNGALCINQ